MSEGSQGLSRKYPGWKINVVLNRKIKIKITSDQLHETYLSYKLMTPEILHIELMEVDYSAI